MTTNTSPDMATPTQGIINAPKVQIPRVEMPKKTLFYCHQEHTFITQHCSKEIKKKIDKFIVNGLKLKTQRRKVWFSTELIKGFDNWNMSALVYSYSANYNTMIKTLKGKECETPTF